MSEIEDSTYCGKCRRCLSRITSQGVISYIHSFEQRGQGRADHPADPVPLMKHPNPYIECDFCSQEEAVWVYICADQETDSRVVVRGMISARDYREKHQAARVQNVKTAQGPLHIWGSRWASCGGCAELVDEHNLLGLISRVTAALPSRLVKGKRLLETRGALFDNYTTMFNTLKPGRGKIAPGHPEGIWEQEEPVVISREPEAVPLNRTEERSIGKGRQGSGGKGRRRYQGRI